MSLRDISFDEIKMGQTVRLHCQGGYTLQGRVNFLEDGGRAVRMGDGYYRVSRWRDEVVRVELLAAPLVVGEVVTEQNKHLLPERYILVSEFGDPWTERSLPFCGNITPYGPLKLIYIHGE